MEQHHNTTALSFSTGASMRQAELASRTTAAPRSASGRSLTPTRALARPNPPENPKNKDHPPQTRIDTAPLLQE
jgi:hypothetical protein